MYQKLILKLKDKHGSEAVTFLLSTTMMLFIFVTLLYSMIYIVEAYNVNYLARRVVRSIEVAGQYDESTINTWLENEVGDRLEYIDISVDADYINNSNAIQLRDEFTVNLEGSYKITIAQMGMTSMDIYLPIKSQVSGMSEVYWKTFSN